MINIKHARKIVSDGLNILAQLYLYKNYKTPFRRSSDGSLHDKGRKKGLTKIDKNDNNNAVTIPVFDIHCKIIGNGNGVEMFTTNTYEFCCHPDNSNIFKSLPARCSDNTNNAFHFISFVLTQVTTIATYRH